MYDTWKHHRIQKESWDAGNLRGYGHEAMKPTLNESSVRSNFKQQFLILHLCNTSRKPMLFVQVLDLRKLQPQYGWRWLKGANMCQHFRKGWAGPWVPMGAYPNLPCYGLHFKRGIVIMPDPFCRGSVCWTFSRKVTYDITWYWLVVSTPLQNISQIGSSSQLMSTLD